MHTFLDFLEFFAVSLGIVAVIFVGVLIGALLIELGLCRDDDQLTITSSRIPDINEHIILSGFRSGPLTSLNESTFTITGKTEDGCTAKIKRDSGHVSFAAGGLLALCALDTWLMVRWPWLITAWLALFFMIALLYRWYGAYLRRQNARRHHHVFDTLEDVAEGYAMLTCKCGAPYCLVRIVK